MNVKGMTILYVLILACVVIILDSNILPEPHEIIRHYAPHSFLAKYSLKDVPYGDKAAHFFLVGTLTFLMNLSLSLSSVSLGNFNVLTGSLLLSVFVSVEETSQMLFPSRSFSLGDLLSNYAGILCFSYAAIWFVQHQRWISSKLPPRFMALFQIPEDV